MAMIEERKQADKRPRERDSEVAREAILHAAEEAFAAHGFSGARVDAIAEAAGYNKALIFHYFGDKLGLYRALMSRTKEQLFARLIPNVERVLGDGTRDVTAADVRAFAADTIRTVFDFYAEHPNNARILAWEAAEGWRMFAVCAPTTPYNWSGRVRELIARGQAAGIVRRDLDPVILFTTVMSLPLIHFVSLPRFQLMFPDTEFTTHAALAHACEQITELVLRGTLAHN